MNPSFDVVVCGLGVNGAAVLHALSEIPGLRVLGLEARTPGHNLSGSWGETRLLRRSYFEDPRYVPLVDQSIAAWSELQKSSDEELFRRTGLLLGGPRDTVAFDSFGLLKDVEDRGTDESRSFKAIAVC